MQASSYIALPISKRITAERERESERERRKQRLAEQSPAMMMETVTVPRFAGGSGVKQGTLRVGSIAAPGASTALATKASIPSRFETVLRTGASEINGFGCRTSRFDELPGTLDLPGPGAYKLRRPVASQSAVSFSRKGLASFAPKVGFQTQRSAVLPTPGPGTYETCHVPMFDKSTAAHVTSVFSPPSARPLLKQVAPKPAPPGPGDYAVPDMISRAPCAALKETTVRDSYRLVARTAPGPGEFLPDSALNMMSAGARPSGRRPAPSPPLVDLVRRSDVDTVVNLPPALREADPYMITGYGPNLRPGDEIAPALKDVSKLRAQLNTIAQHQTALAPLPDRPVKKSAAFADSVLDRFGHSTVPYVARDSGRVGPGTYDPPSGMNTRRMLISSSWALSSVNRDDPGNKGGRYKVPGPAYYHTALPPCQVSHHMLSREYWA